MPDLFEGQDEPDLVDAGLSRADFEMLLGAYADELYQFPPVGACNPHKYGERRARQACHKFARRDVGRVDEAARRLGYALKLVPIK